MGLPLKWKVIGVGAIAVMVLCVSFLVVANKAFNAGKKYQGEPMFAPSTPAAAPSLTKADLTEVVQTENKSLVTTTDAIAKAREEGRQEMLKELDKITQEYFAATRAQNWRQLQGDFARRGAELTGLTVPVASPAPEPAQPEPETKNAEPAPAEPAQPEPAGDAAPPQLSAEPQ